LEPISSIQTQTIINIFSVPAKSHIAKKNIVFVSKMAQNVTNFAFAKNAKINHAMRTMKVNLRKKEDGKDMPLITLIRIKLSNRKWIKILSNIWNKALTLRKSIKICNLSL
jgi:hypothetical protein